MGAFKNLFTILRDEIRRANDRRKIGTIEPMKPDYKRQAIAATLVLVMGVLLAATVTGIKKASKYFDSVAAGREATEKLEVLIQAVANGDIEKADAIEREINLDLLNEKQLIQYDQAVSSIATTYINYGSTEYSRGKYAESAYWYEKSLYFGGQAGNTALVAKMMDQWRLLSVQLPPAQIPVLQSDPESSRAGIQFVLNGLDKIGDVWKKIEDCRAACADLKRMYEDRQRLLSMLPVAEENWASILIQSNKYIEAAAAYSRAISYYSSLEDFSQIDRIKSEIEKLAPDIEEQKFKQARHQEQIRQIQKQAFAERQAQELETELLKYARKGFGDNNVIGVELVMQTDGLGNGGYLAKIAFQANDNVSTNLIRLGIIQSVMDFLSHAIQKPSLKAISVFMFQPHFGVVDNYGQVSNKQIGKILLNRRTLEQINWSNMTHDRFENLALSEGQFYLR